MNKRKPNKLKRIEELENIIRKNITENSDFKDKLKSFGNSYRDYKLNRHKIFQLISNKLDENSNEIAELWFLETF